MNFVRRLLGNRPNMQPLGQGFYIVRTQAGFKAALKRYFDEMPERDIIFNWPKKYPALIALSTGYEGYHYPQVKVLPLGDLKAALKLQGEI